MAQQSDLKRTDALAKAWANIIFDHRNQMAWFIKLTNTDLTTLTPGDIQNLQDQCEAIRMVPISFSPIPSDRKRYPFQRGWMTTPSPNFEDLQRIHEAIAPRLSQFADGAEISFGPMQVKHTVRFRKSTEAEQGAGYPPHLIFPIAILQASNAWPDEFSLRAARLLEEFVDGIHRCPHCKQVFLQLRRNATYCGRTCHSVAGMQRLRAQRALEMPASTHGPRTAQKRRAPHGKKRR